VAIIMDGNGRWATARGLPRIAGHRAGVDAVRRTVEAARELGIGTLTLYAFSSDNWKRPPAEVSALMQLFRAYLAAEKPRCIAHGIRLEVIGRRDRLDPALAAAIEEAERETARGRALHLRIAVDYSARDAILRAAARLDSRCDVTRELFARLMGGAPDVDLLIRTGGERRLSDFLLWESAYAELVFTPCMWPEFAREDLESVLLDFSRRERRFGGLPAPNGKTVFPADVV
jgi:undecaprenyl diphosphate synthase